MLDTLINWLSQPTVYIAIGALSAFIIFKLLISLGILLFKKYVIDVDKAKDDQIS